ncbi:MAG: hypothetical protein NTY38_32595, partial [Acidobacteria bacterium]|nr:hypothetical protein [Acidobacteriota bacterium]
MRNAVKAIILFIAAATLLMGQVSQFTVHTDVSGATFRVDGRDYKSQTVFLWPAGSKHTLELLAQPYDADGIQQYTCSTWADSAGLLIPNGSLVQVVAADSRITSFKGTCTVSGYRVDLYFYGDSVSPLQATPNVCEAPGNPSSNQSRVGLVQVASPLLNGCFWQSTYFYTRGLMTLNAFPYPGCVFTGWSPGAASSTAYLTTFNVTRHLQLTAKFDPARRVQFRTKPSGLQVAVDRDFINTPALSPCPDSQWLPIGPVGMNLTVAGLYGPMCSGDFDFPFGSKHVLAAPSPQTDTA